MSKTDKDTTSNDHHTDVARNRSEGTMLIQRGDLAHMSQFAYSPETDFTAVIQQAMAALAVVESDPPVIPDVPPRKTAPSPAASPEPPEPMIQIPTKTKKGTTAIPARLLQITGGETDEAAQQQALKVAGRLLDSGLWDGKTPIGIDDAPCRAAQTGRPDRQGTEGAVQAGAVCAAQSQSRRRRHRFAARRSR